MHIPKMSQNCVQVQVACDRTGGEEKIPPDYYIPPVVAKRNEIASEQEVRLTNEDFIDSYR